MTRAPARQVCEQAGIGPGAVDVVEQHNLGLGGACVVTLYQAA